MAKTQSKKRGKKEEDFDEADLLQNEENFFERHNIHTDKLVAIFFLFLSVFTFSSLFGLAGNIGTDFFTFITENLGLYAYLTPLTFLFIFYTIIFNKYFIFRRINFYLLLILLINFFVAIGFFGIAGRLGNNFTDSLQTSFGTFPIVFVLFTTSTLILFRLFEVSIVDLITTHLKAKQSDAEETPVVSVAENQALERVQEMEEDYGEDKSSKGMLSSTLSKLAFWRTGEPEEVQALQVNHITNDEIEEDEYEEVEIEEEPVEDKDVRSAMYKAAGVHLTKEEKERVKVKRLVKKEPTPETSTTARENKERLRQLSEKYSRPPLSMYTEDSGKSSAGDNKENARIIKRTLNDFGISVEMDEVTVGPTVTRYALKPAQGVKIEKIMNLANNIALELGVPSVSIIRVHERSLIGVEVPNKQKSRLGLSNLLGNSQFLERKDKLTITLGKDIYGEPVFTDLAKTPHLLVAGTTGSGKSVLVHSILNSLIYKNSPYDLKFILVDPKKVELALYNNLPHLYTPVIKDPKKAVQTLNWLVQEMDRRYAVLEEYGKQNIAGYHTFALEKYRKAEVKGGSEKLPERMPYIVLVIDELADFMMKYPKEMESGIVKLAQMSRAVGIHLILATQRPSTNIITGVIKGNIPSRVALRVASQVDSRVIIDQGGAEKLLGYGDLLFVSADGGDVKRIQSPFVSEEEIKDVVAYLRSKYEDVVAEELKTKDGAVVGAQNLQSQGSPDGPNRYNGDTDFSAEDDKFEDAKQVVMQSGKTSISNLQVRLGTGYARSAKLINMLEQAGVIITATDNNGKKTKVVAGSQAAESQKLEQQADELLETEEVEEASEVEPEKGKEEASFFRF